MLGYNKQMVDKKPLRESQNNNKISKKSLLYTDYETT